MQLSTHFSLEELTVTQVRGVDNSPPPDIQAVLQDTAQRMEAVRALLGFPINVSSGYRCEEVNRIVGGVPDSDHLIGRAVDFICPPFGNPLAICQTLTKSGIQFDQIIEEGTWVHISFNPQMRGQVFTKKPGGGYSVGLKT